MVGEVHELVDEIGLIEIVGNRAEFAVSRQVLPVGRLTQRT